MNINTYSAFSNVNLTASFDQGQTTPNEVPVVYINGPYAGEANTAVNFSSAGSYDADGSITSYQWDFGDGTTSTLANPSHTYTAENNFVVTLSVTDNGGLTETATTTANITAVTVPISNAPDMCSVQGPQSGGEAQAGQAICLGNIGTSWFTIGDVSGHSSIAISTGHGAGDLNLEFSNMGWPNGSNNHGASNNVGNAECIYLTNMTEYWGYIKVSGAASNASLVVDFDTNGCR